MSLIESANTLLSLALTATPSERLDAINRLVVVDEDGNRNKSAIKRLNNALIGVLKLRDQVAVELQEEPWGNVSQLDLFRKSGKLKVMPSEQGGQA